MNRKTIDSPALYGDWEAAADPDIDLSEEEAADLADFAYAHDPEFVALVEEAADLANALAAAEPGLDSDDAIDLAVDSVFDGVDLADPSFDLSSADQDDDLLLSRWISEQQ